MNSENPGGLAPELEWMLQSGQVEESTLLKALISEYRRPLFVLALGYLGDPSAAAQSSPVAFGMAVLNVYKYRGDGATAWFYRQALESLHEASKQQNPPGKIDTGWSKDARQALWQAVQALPSQHRVLILLHEALGVTEQQTAQIFGWKIQEAQAHLAEARSHALRQLAELRFTEQDLPEGRLSPALSALVEAIWPDWEQSLPSEETLYQEAIGNVQRNGLLRRRFTSFKESLFVIVAAAVFLLILWQVNTWMTEPESISIAAATGTASAHARETAFQNVMQRRNTPTPRQSFYSLSFPESAFYYVLPRDTLDVIAQRLNISSRELWRLNRLPEGDPLVEGQRLLIPGRVTPNPISIPTRGPYRAEARAPLPENPTAEEVIERTLLYGNFGEGGAWGDIEFVLYGGRAYSGLPQHLRLQLWIMDPGPTMILIGHPGKPETALMMVDEGILFAMPGKGSPWFRLLEEEDYYVMNQFILFAYAFGVHVVSGYEFQDIELSIVDRKPFRGRDAFLIEAANREGSVMTRYWIDPEIPLPLRVEGFSPSGELAYETGLRDYATDIYLPQDLFDAGLPWRGGFAGDFTGEPEPLNAPTFLDPEEAPARLDDQRRGYPDVSRSFLIFQYPESYDLLGSLNWSEATERVQVFADDFYLGEIPFYQPFLIQCRRSPDGKRIAYSGIGDSGELVQPSENMYLYNLDERRLEDPIENVFVSSFAFSPDGNTLAVAGRENSFGGKSRVFFYDLGTAEMLESLQVENPRQLTWRPDGSQLALMYTDFDYQRSPTEVMAVWDVSTGEEIYTDDIQNWNREPFRDWPTNDWGVDFPRYPDTSLAACAQPPPE